ncbi:MAG: hypothetical protein LLF95_06280 [Bacteroidales bacterium]|nr:hypothetical protein [Bacteroidales bacterium]
MKKIPVNIISGFLGSGKTTAIVQLLHEQISNEKWAVIINEFGKISIDSLIICNSLPTFDSIFNISGGCICCSSKEYFTESLNQIVNTLDFDRIIIEPSGLGGIDMVSKIVKMNLQLYLVNTICMVDITGLENNKLQINPIYQLQIKNSDKIVLSKCDLQTDKAEENRLIELFKKKFPNKKYQKFISENDLGMDEFLEQKISSSNLDKIEKLDENYRITHFNINANIVFDMKKLSNFFNCQSEIVRAKGYLRTKTNWNLCNYTLTGFQTELCSNKESNILIVIYMKGDNTNAEKIKIEIEKTIVCQY